MSLVTEVYFRSVTGDYETAASAVEENLDAAQSMIQEYLQRTLPYGTYTERLQLWPNRHVYPSAVPVTEIPVSATYYIHDEATIHNASPEDSPNVDWPFVDVSTEPFGGWRGSGYDARYGYSTVTYTGGFTASTLPVTIRQAIVKLAHSLPLQYTSSVRPGGASSVGVGDVRMSWRAEDTASVLDQFVPGLSKLLKGYRLDRL